jgi:hypothetical protein
VVDAAYPQTISEAKIEELMSMVGSIRFTKVAPPLQDAAAGQ